MNGKNALDCKPRVNEEDVVHASYLDYKVCKGQIQNYIMTYGFLVIYNNW